MDNQETREVTTIYADGSTVTMTIDRKTGALLDYNATPPPPRTTGAGLQGLAKRVETLEQSRTSDIADFVRKAEIFSEEHTTILPELLPDPEIKWLKGKGRPDKPETTEGAIVGDEADCTRYLSTDGAGTGAWEWEKRGGVWHVVRGDTGWRKITSGALADTSFILIRRTEVQVDVQFYNIGNWGIIKFKPWSQARTANTSFSLYDIPEGFRGCMAVICPLYDDNMLTQIGGINFNTVVSGSRHLMTARFAPNIDKENIPGVRPGLFNFPTVDAWPSSLPGESFEAICPTT